MYIHSYTYVQLKFVELLELLRTKFLNIRIEDINQKDFTVSFFCLGKIYKYRCSADSIGDDILVRYLPEFRNNDRLFPIICRKLLRRRLRCSFVRIHSENVLWIKKASIGMDCSASEIGIPIRSKSVMVLHNSFLIDCKLPQHETGIYYEKLTLEFNFEGLALSIADNDDNVKVVMPEEKDIFPKEIYRHHSTSLFETLLERLVPNNYKFGYIVFLCFEGIDTEMYMEVVKRHFPDSEICCQFISNTKSVLPDLRSTVAFFRDKQLFAEQYGPWKFSIRGFLDDYFGELHVCEAIEGELFELASDKTERFHHSFENSASIGRSSMNDICIDEDSVSMWHAKISLINADCAKIEDLGSICGTFVNGEIVTDKHIVKNGDVVRIGNCNDFIFQIREIVFGKTHIPCRNSLFYQPYFLAKREIV